MRLPRPGMQPDPTPVWSSTHCRWAFRQYSPFQSISYQEVEDKRPGLFTMFPDSVDPRAKIRTTGLQIPFSRSLALSDCRASSADGGTGPAAAKAERDATNKEGRIIMNDWNGKSWIVGKAYRILFFLSRKGAL